MAYLYRHIRLDKNEVFYIGIGVEHNYNRAFTRRSRSGFWKKVVAKTPYEVEIMLDDLTWEDACDKEKEFIKFYGRKNLNQGTLCNLTDGGEGVLGLKHTDKTKNLISKKGIGRKATAETKRRLSLAKTGSKMPLDSIRKTNLKKRLSQTSNRKCLVLDLSTGIYFYSVLEAASSYNLNPSTLHQKLRGSRANNTTLLKI